MIAAAHPYGHEEPHEVSRAEFESTVRKGSCLQEDTLEDFSTEEVLEGMHRELDLMKSFPMHLPVPRVEVTVKVWSTRWWCYRRKGPKQVRVRVVVWQFATSLNAAFYRSAPGVGSRESCWSWLC